MTPGQDQPAPALVDRLRLICLDLPEAAEKETWEIPTFRVREKIFAMVHEVKGAPSVWCKAPRGAQTILVNAAPERFFIPPYVGHKGWIGIWLDAEVDWDEMRDVIRRSYLMTAPKRLAAPLERQDALAEVEPPLSSPGGTPGERSPRRSPPSRPPTRRPRASSGH